VNYSGWGTNCEHFYAVCTDFTNTTCARLPPSPLCSSLAPPPAHFYFFLSFFFSFFLLFLPCSWPLSRSLPGPDCQQRHFPRHHFQHCGFGGLQRRICWWSANQAVHADWLEQHHHWNPVLLCFLRCLQRLVPPCGPSDYPGDFLIGQPSNPPLPLFSGQRPLRLLRLLLLLLILISEVSCASILKNERRKKGERQKSGKPTRFKRRERERERELWNEGKTKENKGKQRKTKENKGKQRKTKENKGKQNKDLSFSTCIAVSKF